MICPQRELLLKNEEYWSVGVMEKTVLESRAEFKLLILYLSPATMFKLIIP